MGKDSELPQRVRRGFDPLLLGAIGFLLGGIIGGCMAAFTGLSIEEHFVQEMFDPDVPFYPYGKGVLVYLPFCAFVGAATGFVIGAAFCRTWELASSMLVITAILTAGCFGRASIH